jgi:hypothetical protein
MVGSYKGHIIHFIIVELSYFITPLLLTAMEE